MANLSNEVQEFENPFNQSFTDYMKDEKLDLSSTAYMKLKPWQYYILLE